MQKWLRWTQSSTYAPGLSTPSYISRIVAQSPLSSLCCPKLSSRHLWCICWWLSLTRAFLHGPAAFWIALPQLSTNLHEFKWYFKLTSEQLPMLCFHIYGRRCSVYDVPCIRFKSLTLFVPCLNSYFRGVEYSHSLKLCKGLHSVCKSRILWAWVAAPTPTNMDANKMQIREVSSNYIYGMVYKIGVVIGAK